MKRIIKCFTLVLAIDFFFAPTWAMALEKQEMVYSNLDYNGSTIKNVITNHLTKLEKGEINDETELKSILNLNGDETYVLEDQSITWKSEGKDIFYQGDVEKELPIKTSISYYYNDKEEDAKSILGRKGHIKIVFHFTNLEKHIVNNEVLYTPFVTFIGTMLDSIKNTNVEISNGKVVSNGKYYMIVGLALPGMHDNLDLETFNNSDEVTLEFDTECFEMKNVYMVSSPKVLDESDLDVFLKMDELSSKVKELQSKMNQIDKGASDLKNGVAKLSQGTKQLYQNSFALKSGANTLAGGVKSLNNGLESAFEGVSKIEKGSQDVDENLKRILKGIVKSEQKLSLEKKNLDNKLQQITLLRKNNELAISKLKSANNDIKKQFQNEKIDVLQSEETIKKLVVEKITSEVTKQMQGASKESINAIVESQSKEMLSSLLTYKRLYDSNESMIKLLSSNDETVLSLSQALRSSVNSIEKELGTLNTYLQELEKKGTKELTNGVKSLKSGLEKLYQGSSTLESGFDQVNLGIDKFADGTKAIDNGTLEIEEGTIALSEGISRFNREGIFKLTSKLSNYENKMKQLTLLSKDYKGFGSNNAKSTVFVSVTKSLKSNCTNSSDLE